MGSLGLRWSKKGAMENSGGSSGTVRQRLTASKLLQVAAECYPPNLPRLQLNPLAASAAWELQREPRQCPQPQASAQPQPKRSGNSPRNFFSWGEDSQIETYRDEVPQIILLPDCTSDWEPVVRIKTNASSLRMPHA